MLTTAGAIAQRRDCCCDQDRDRIIDLGPEGGEEGGKIVAHGTPEQVAAKAGSYTGAFLADVVKPAATKKRPPRPKVATAA